MNALKTIVVTWNDTRPGFAGNVLAALWAAEGTDADLNDALARGYRVHTFATDEPQWKAKALKAHIKGWSL
jgi:hypothetical protein